MGVDVCGAGVGFEENLENEIESRFRAGAENASATQYCSYPGLSD